LNVRGVERTKVSGNKAARYLEAQPYAASKCISLTRYAKHADMCIKHMGKITANNTHRYDDICDTFYDAVKGALIDCTVPRGSQANLQRDKTIKRIATQFQRSERLRRQSYG
jgi:hypothetical protein